MIGLIGNLNLSRPVQRGVQPSIVSTRRAGAHVICGDHDVVWLQSRVFTELTVLEGSRLARLSLQPVVVDARRGLVRYAPLTCKLHGMLRDWTHILLDHIGRGVGTYTRDVVRHGRQWRRRRLAAIARSGWRHNCEQPQRPAHWARRARQPRLPTFPPS